MNRGTSAHSLNLPLVWRDLLSELRLPLSVIKCQADMTGSMDIKDSASHALRLVESYLMAADLHYDPPELSPNSLHALTNDVLHQVSTLASEYRVDLVTDYKRMTSPVAVNADVYKRALHGLLHSAISSLQNENGSQLSIGIKTEQRPSLFIFGSNLNITAEDLVRSHSKPMHKPAPMREGINSGLVLANDLFSHMGSELIHTSNQHGHGFKASFNFSHQMVLTDIL